jgi:uncharacterized lipoprotein YmbA
MTTRRIFPGLLILALLAGCGSTPQSNYYMLDATLAGAPGLSGLSVGVGPVSIPSYLDRQSMVVNSSANQLKITPYDRWAETLDVGVVRVISVNLATLLDTQSVQTFPWPRMAAPDYGVEIGIVELSNHDKQAQLVAKWVLTDIGASEVIKQKISQYQVPLKNTDPVSVAAAYSTLLGMLSKELAAAIPR